MAKKNLQNLQKLLELMDSEAFTQEDFIKSFEMVLEIVSQTKKMTEEEVANLRTMFTEAQSELKSSTTERFDMLKSRVLSEMTETLNKTETKLLQTMSDLTSRMDDLEEPDDEEEQDLIDRAVETTLSKIPPPKELKPETKESIREKLLPIEIDDVTDLRRELDELKARPVGRVGGGTSAIGVRQAFKYIAHTEQPSGLINGSNTIYTVKNEIFWVAGFTLNGEQIAELPNFTYSGKTITFSSALPSAYSGKDFEIKYIG